MPAVSVFVGEGQQGLSRGASLSLHAAVASVGVALAQSTQGPGHAFEPSPEDLDRYYLDNEELDDLIQNAPGSEMQFEDVAASRRRGLEDLCDNVVKGDGVALFCRWVSNGVRGLGTVVVTVVSTAPLAATLPLPPLPLPPSPLPLGASPPPAVAPPPPPPPLVCAPLLPAPK